MKRFRFTILAVCLVLLYLGWTDISNYLNNRNPAEVALSTLVEKGPPQQWLNVTGGTLDLEQAISTSGSIELDALLVPLKSSPDQESFEVLVETRDPKLLDLFETYHLQLDSYIEKRNFLQEHQSEFHSQREVTGMVITGLIASGNRDKLMDLAEEVGMEIPEDVIFISEGKEPPTWRGFFFALIGLLGIIRVLSRWRTPAPEPAGDQDMTVPPKE